MATKFVNQVYFPIPARKGLRPDAVSREDIGPRVLEVPELIPQEEREAILEELENSNWLPVSVTGMSGNYTPGDRIGSYRASNFTQRYAECLWDRLERYFPAVELFSNPYPTDFDGSSKWEPIGVSPLLRFIRYEDGGCLVPHYDAPYIESPEVRTLKSLVIYLDEDETIKGGVTRFLHDSQSDLPVSERNLEDSLEIIEEGEESALLRVGFHPVSGTGLIFPHRIWHDSSPVVGVGRKTIIRTDILYRRI